MAIRVIDTDVWSYIYKGRDEGTLYQPHLFGNILVISFQTQAELMRWVVSRVGANNGGNISNSIYKNTS